MAIVDITGLDQIEVFRRLYNGSQPLGMGFLHAKPEDMSYEQAQQEFSLDVDYHRGRVMKITLRSREGLLNDLTRAGLSDEEISAKLPGEDVTHFFESWLYDRDNGNGACEKIITNLRRELAAKQE
jgi:hypothetical protein